MRDSGSPVKADTQVCRRNQRGPHPGTSTRVSSSSCTKRAPSCCSSLPAKAQAARGELEPYRTCPGSCESCSRAAGAVFACPSFTKTARALTFTLLERTSTILYLHRKQACTEEFASAVLFWNCQLSQKKPGREWGQVSQSWHSLASGAEGGWGG